MAADIAMHCSMLTLIRVSNAMSSAWPAIMAAVASARTPAADRATGHVEQHLVGEGLQGVAGDDGLAEAEQRPDGRADAGGSRHRR